MPVRRHTRKYRKIKRKSNKRTRKSNRNPIKEPGKVIDTLKNIGNLIKFYGADPNREIL